MTIRLFSKLSERPKVVIPSLVLYTRKGCTLCEKMKAELQDLSQELEFHLLEIDIDQDPLLSIEYNDRIPYLLLEGKPVAKHRLDKDKLRQRLIRWKKSQR